ncbi:MAG: four helix bundle protein [Patescibacteria group bacterium]|nr:four helix bundle protein [Patescibacteria group bacterium]MDE1944853.1 four helix bundle protein [Patescibacteria group bacterium]MDE2057299.1 four helix bundle protein [Patescibacteria group bacterium]
MSELDIPIFKKSYDLYRAFYGYRLDVPRQDRYALWQQCENGLLAVIEDILYASQSGPREKLPMLEKASARLNILRVFVRLAKDVKAIDGKKYVAIEQDLDEIGRMLGGWIRSTKDR